MGYIKASLAGKSLTNFTKGLPKSWGCHGSGVWQVYWQVQPYVGQTMRHRKPTPLVLDLFTESLQNHQDLIPPQNLSHSFPDISFHWHSKEKWIKLRIKVKKANNNGLCCQREGARLGRAVFPNWPSLTDSLPPRKKGRPARAGQKKSQQTKWKQIKSTIIKHRCYKENKLHKI